MIILDRVFSHLDYFLLQLLERREQTGTAAMADVGEGLCQGGRGGARRSEEEEEDEDNEEEEDIHGSTRPHYPHHHNLLANPSGLRPGKDGGAARTPQDSFSVFLRQQSEGGGMPSTGVTNPIYGHLGDLRDQAGGTWGSLAPTPGTEQPTDTLGSLLEAGAGAGTLEGSPSHPLLHLGRLGEQGSQSQAPEAHHWASLASTHPLHHQTTDLLNNQVSHSVPLSVSVTQCQSPAPLLSSLDLVESGILSSAHSSMLKSFFDNHLFPNVKKMKINCFWSGV